MSDKPERPASRGAPLATRRGERDGANAVFSLSEEETMDLGRNFARALRGGELILLVGDLGLGKTVFARGIAIGLNIPPEDVTSPSFTLIQEYRGGRLPMYHVDLYRLGDPEDIATLGIDDLLAEPEAVIVVEWGEKLPPFYTRDAVTVRLHDVGEGCRRVEVSGARPQSVTRVGDA